MTESIIPNGTPWYHRASLWSLIGGLIVSGLAAPDRPQCRADTMRTVAGTGSPENNGSQGAADAIAIGDPFGVEIGPDTALYITEVRNHRVWRLDLTSRQVRVVAGNGRKGYAGDGGPATAAELNEPYEVRFDRDGNMYFVEMQNHLVRRVDRKTGTISTVAGTGSAGFSGDGGPALAATFRQPHSIVLDHQGGLYIADIGNHRIRKVDLERGTVNTYAGTGERQLPRDGQPVTGTPVLGPRALYLDGRTMWVALREGHSVWKINLDEGRWRHVAGTGKQGFSGDGGPAATATFNGPKGIAADRHGNLFVVDTENQAIRRIDAAAGTITTIAGSGPQQRGFGGDDGPATAGKLDRPHGIGLDAAGGIYLGDTLNHRVRWIEPSRQ